MSADTRKLVTNENLSAFAERLAEKVPLKSDLPTKVSDLANDRGFTDNAGTITSVTINGVTTSSGGVNLGYLVAAENGKGLSSNDYTTAEKNKLAGIDSGAEANTIETVKVNGVSLTPDGNKAVDVTVPTTVAELSDASNYALASDLEDYAQVSDLEDTEEVLTAAVTDLNSRLEDAEDALEDVTDRVESLQYTVQTFPTDISEFNNDSGYITTETDPVFSASPAAQISTTDMAYWDGKQDPLTFDSVPTQNSTNPVTSGGLYTVITQNEYTAATALNELNDRVSDLEEIQVPEVDEYPTENSNNAVSSGGVYEVITENELAIAASLSNLDSRIPENISDLNDDVGLATTSSLSDYVLKSDYEDDEEVLATAVNDLNTRVTDLEDAPAFTETDPVFSASAAAGITSADITNWNSKTSNTGTLTGVSCNGTGATVTNGVASISVKEGDFVIDLPNGWSQVDEFNQYSTVSLPAGTYNAALAAFNSGRRVVVREAPGNSFTSAAVYAEMVYNVTNDDAWPGLYFVPIEELNSYYNYAFHLYSEDSIQAEKLNTPINSVYFNGTYVSPDQYSESTVRINETDPVFSASAASGITAADITNWNGKTSNTGTVVGSGLTADKLVLGNGTTNIKTSTYGVSTSAPTSSSDNTTIPTSAAVFNAIDTALTSVLTYKGTIGSSGATVSALPASHAVGDVYVVSIAGTYAGKACEVGDYIICNTDGSSASDAHWNVVTGENQVDNKSASLAAAGSSATIATVDGTNITVTTPSGWTGVDKTGTITGITMNSTSMGTSGVVDLGNVAAPSDVMWEAGTGTGAIKTKGSSGTAGGNYSTVEGKGSVTGGTHTTYDLTPDTADSSAGSYAHAEGRYTIASGAQGSHAEGDRTLASGKQSHAEGASTVASGMYSHAEGGGTSATKGGAHAEGLQTIASGSYSHAEGQNTKTVGTASHSEGNNTVSEGMYSHVEGWYTRAIGNVSHAEGQKSAAIGLSSHAEGISVSVGVCSHSESGDKGVDLFPVGAANATTYTSAFDSTEWNPVRNQVGDTIFCNVLKNSVIYPKNTETRSIGIKITDASLSGETITFTVEETLSETALDGSINYWIPFSVAYGPQSHSENSGNVAYGEDSHAEGYYNFAIGNQSHVEGRNTISRNISEHAEGSFNVSNKASDTYGNAGNTQHSIGIGNSTTRKNAIEIMQNGDVYVSGIGSYDGTNYSSASTLQSVLGTIPAAVTESTVSGWGFTKNTGTLTTETDPVFSASAAAGITSSDITNWNGKTSNTGTITGITMNGASKGTSGVVNLGTVITSETQLSKGTTTGAGNAVTDISVSNHQITLTKGATFLTEHQSIKTINNQTITGTGNVNISGLPAVTSSDNGKILQVVNGAWALVSPISIYSGSESPSNSIGNDGDIYIQS